MAEEDDGRKRKGKGKLPFDEEESEEARKREQEGKALQEETPFEIEALPEELTLYILSKITADESMDTRLVSRRWRSLWTQIPALHFLADTDEPRTNFMSFVEKVLHLRGGISQRIESFEISCDLTHCREPQISRWIMFALGCNARSIALNLYFRTTINLPPVLFNNDTLEALRLRINWFSTLPRQVSLPNLRTLSLIFAVNQLNPDSVPLFLSKCPKLEHLTLGGCFPRLISIRVPLLKRFNLRIRDFTEPNLVEFNAPLLEDLTLDEENVEHYDTTAMEKISSAKLSLKRVIEHRTSLTHIFQAIQNVRSLHLGSATTQSLVNLGSSQIHHFPVFHNLLYLRIEMETDECINLLPLLVTKAPNLKKVTVEVKWSEYAANRLAKLKSELAMHQISLDTVYQGKKREPEKESEMKE